MNNIFAVLILSFRKTLNLFISHKYRDITFYSIIFINKNYKSFHTYQKITSIFILSFIFIHYYKTILYFNLLLFYYLIHLNFIIISLTVPWLLYTLISHFYSQNPNFNPYLIKIIHINSSEIYPLLFSPKKFSNTHFF